jgi:hypothetical protein
MANRSDRDDLHAPPLFKTFTSFAAQKVLESADAPPNAQHLPCQLTVQVGAGAQHLDVKDSNGTVNVLTFPAAGSFTIRMAPSTIETTTNVAGVTVFWQPMARTG